MMERGAKHTQTDTHHWQSIRANFYCLWMCLIDVGFPLNVTFTFDCEQISYGEVWSDRVERGAKHTQTDPHIWESLRAHFHCRWICLIDVGFPLNVTFTFHCDQNSYWKVSRRAGYTMLSRW